MIFAAGLLLGLALAWFANGHVGGLRSLELRGENLLVVVFIVTAALGFLVASTGSRRFVLPLWLTLMCLLLLFCVANLGKRGFALLAIGVAMNLLVISLNAAMPVLLPALTAAGGDATAGIGGADSFHRPTCESSLLPLIADSLPLPGPRIVRGVLSPGDVLMAVGVAVVIAGSVIRET